MYSRFIVPIILLVCVAGFASAQKMSPRLLGSAGGHAKGSAITISYSVGETFIRTHTKGSARVTEGFQGASTSNPKLINLVLSKGTLGPVFSSDKTNYTASVTYDVASVTVTPTTSNAQIKISVNDSVVTSATASKPIQLSSGNNLIKVVVTGKDLAKKTYTVVVNKPNPESIITFSGKVLLQSAYNISSGLMSNTLNTSGILQSNAVAQPYGAIYNYQGMENVGAGFFAAHPAVVDWVLIELRDPQNPATIVSSRAVLLKTDGTLLETDGVSNLISFQGIAQSSYYVVVRHRNHLSIRSSGAVDFSSGVASYDFTTAANKTYSNQSATSMVQVGTMWAMRGGNSNSNNNVKYNGPFNDQDRIQNAKLNGSLSIVLTNQYAPEDLNMDGVIKTNGPGNDQNFLLNTILGGFLAVILQEQL